MTLATEAPVVESELANGLDEDATRPNESIHLMMASLSDAYELTEREGETARLVFLGFDLPTIAERLDLSEKTAGWQLQDVFAKTGTDSAKSLIKLALRHARELEQADAPKSTIPRWANVNDDQ